jgi:hypothetical protein
VREVAAWRREIAQGEHGRPLRELVHNIECTGARQGVWPENSNQERWIGIWDETITRR